MTTIQTKFPSVDRGRPQQCHPGDRCERRRCGDQHRPHDRYHLADQPDQRPAGVNLDSGSSLTIAGSGAAGCEYASIFAALGTRVTIVGGSHLLPAVDAEMAGVLGECFNALGIRVIPKVSASALRWCLSPQNPR